MITTAAVTTTILILFVGSFSSIYGFFHDKQQEKGSLYECFKHYRDIYDNQKITDPNGTIANFYDFYLLDAQFFCEIGYEDSGIYPHLLSEEDTIKYNDLAYQKAKSLYLIQLFVNNTK